MDILFLWAGLAFAWVGMLILRWERSTAGGERADGEILGYAERVDADDGSRTYAPVIAFRHPLAGRRVFESALASSALPYAVGKRVKVLIDRNDPAVARLETRAFFYFGFAFAAMGVGLVVLFFAIFDWSAFSVLVAVVVSILLLRERRRSPAAEKLGALSSTVSELVGGKAMEEKDLDRTRLLSTEEVRSTRESTQRASRVAAVLFLLMGVAAAFGGAHWTQRRSAFLRGAESTSGKVVELAISEDADSTTWAPVVQFAPAGSWPRRFRHSVSSTHPSWRVGDTVRVLYDPSDPAQAMIDSGRWNLVPPLLLTAAGIVAAFLSGLAIWRGPG